MVASNKTNKLRVAKVLVTIFFSFVYLSVDAQSKKIKEAHTLYDKKEYLQAIEAYQAILADNPSTANIKAKMADCYWQTNSFSTAQKYYAEAADNGELTPIDMYRYAECLTIVHHIAEAKKWYEEYVKVTPCDKVALSKLKSCSIYLDSANTMSCVDASTFSSHLSFSSPEIGKINVPVTFDASHLGFKDEKPTGYYWNFEENAIGLGNTIKHSFSENRLHTVYSSPPKKPTKNRLSIAATKQLILNRVINRATICLMYSNTMQN